MNTIDQLLALLPPGWFSDAAKAPGGTLYTLLSGVAAILDYISAGIAYVKAQTRINTATGENLDNISADFFGEDLPRVGGETDEAFRVRIVEEIFREKVTRAGLIKAVEDLGCTVVEVFEPSIDGFFTDYSCLDATRVSNDDPYEGMLFITRPLNPANTNLLYTDWNYTDYNYIPSSDSNIWQITDEEIFRVIEATKAAGITVWAVLDPIHINDTNGDNHTSVERYYVPSITKPSPPVGVMDETYMDDGSIMS